MHQRWGKLLFLHWRVPVDELRPLVPAQLELDTWYGEAWVALTPFTMWNIRPALLPPLPVLSRSHELNARTYVIRDGLPGVWFFSLEANNRLAVSAARAFFRLPYYRAEMELREEGATIHYRSHRTHPDAPPADFHAEWARGEPIPELEPGTRDHFLIERYALYTESDGRLYRARIHHAPWPLCGATLHALETTVLEAAGIATPADPPLLHQQREPIDVAVWPLERLS
jgi:uncharacterized protein